MDKRNETAKESIRGQYERHGIQGFYELAGDTYRNPHEPAIREVLHQAVEQWHPDLTHVLDLACGSGEVTLALRKLGCIAIDGIDPYTGQAYLQRTGQPAVPYTFEQIAAGAIADQSYSLIVCSFALHLAEISRLPMLAYQLSIVASSMMIITPHKRPQLKQTWGWSQQDEFVIARVRARLYQAVR
jgi:ubiquinone/menaquinone biosynthesis C-methylase UbiE